MIIILYVILYYSLLFISHLENGYYIYPQYALKITEKQYFIEFSEVLLHCGKLFLGRIIENSLSLGSWRVQ